MESPLLSYVARLGEFADSLEHLKMHAGGLPAPTMLEELQATVTAAESLLDDAPKALDGFAEFGIELIAELGTFRYRLQNLIIEGENAQQNWEPGSHFWDEAHSWICEEIYNAHFWNFARLFFRGQAYLAMYADGQQAPPLKRKKYVPDSKTKRIIKLIEAGQTVNQITGQVDTSNDNVYTVKRRMKNGEYEL